MISLRVGGGGVAGWPAAAPAGGVAGGCAGACGCCASVTSPSTFAARVAMMPVWRNSLRSICRDPLFDRERDDRRVAAGRGLGRNVEGRVAAAGDRGDELLAVGAQIR